MNLWDQFLAYLGLTQPVADGTINNIPQSFPGEEGPAGPQGVAGPPGPPGPTGPSVVLTVSVLAPPAGVGNEGDLWLEV